MKKSYRIYALVALLIIFFASSCLVEPKYPSEPSIKFNSVNLYYDPSIDIKDSIGISIDFQDGDGDLGLNKEDTVGNPDFFNFYINILVKNESGEFEEFEIPDGLVLHGRFPRLDESGKAKPLEGTITYYQNMSAGFHGTFSEKTIKFKVKIIDRALNESNVIETDSLLIPKF